MAFDAVINGVPVHSDKQMKSIRDSRVEFTDGSWCDVATGEVVSKGRGEIKMGNTASDKSGDTTKGPERFQASSLDLRELAADVRVEPHQGSDMEVTITGPEKEVKAIRTHVRGQTLVVEGSAQSGSGMGGISISSRGGRSVIRGGGVVIGGNVFTGGIFGNRSSVVIGGGGDNPTKVTVKVPLGSPISVSSGDAGDTHIGDVNGPLTAYLSASGDLEAGRMTDVDLHVQGSGDIRVAEVNGSAAVHVQGSGDVNIDGGSITRLTASVQGSGDVKVDAVAQQASLTVQGSGDIRVSRVMQEPHKSVHGSGDIRVRRVG